MSERCTQPQAREPRDTKGQIWWTDGLYGASKERMVNIHITCKGENGREWDVNRTTQRDKRKYAQSKTQKQMNIWTFIDINACSVQLGNSLSHQRNNIYWIATQSTNSVAASTNPPMHSDRTGTMVQNINSTVSVLTPQNTTSPVQYEATLFHIFLHTPLLAAMIDTGTTRIVRSNA